MSDHYLWPMGIAAGLMLVVVVNFTFIYVALQHAPDVEPSYDLVDER